MGRKKVEDTTAKTEVGAVIECAHATCGLSAIVKVQTPTGWAKFCEPHYVAYHKALADAKFKELGLERWSDESREDHRKRVFEYMKLLAKFKRFGENGIEEAA